MKEERPEVERNLVVRWRGLRVMRECESRGRACPCPCYASSTKRLSQSIDRSRKRPILPMRYQTLSHWIHANIFCSLGKILFIANDVIKKPRLPQSALAPSPI